MKIKKKVDIPNVKCDSRYKKGDVLTFEGFTITIHGVDVNLWKQIYYSIRYSHARVTSRSVWVGASFLESLVRVFGGKLRKADKPVVKASKPVVDDDEPVVKLLK